MEPIWRVIGASVQGTSHQKRDTPCQDAHGYRVLAGEVVLVAVADGAGSAERSHEGAQCAVETVLVAVEAALAEGEPQDAAAWEVLLAEAFRQARQAILQLGAGDDLSPRAFATTLTCAVACDAALAIGQIGDGIVVAGAKDGELFAATQPQRGEYANETFFLTMAEALQQVEIHVYPGAVEALAVMSDGLIRLAMNLATYEPHVPFFRPLLAFAAQAEDSADAEAQLASLLASERVCARTDDDKTLVLVARSSDPDPMTEEES